MESTIRSLKNESGQSLVQVLAATAIMGIVSMAIAEMMAVQSRESRALSEKMATLTFSNQLIQALSTNAVCTGIVTALSPNTFNSTNLTPTAPVILDFTSIPGIGGVGSLASAAVGAPISALSNTAIVQTIQLEINSRSTNDFSANFRIALNDAQLVRPLRPLIFPIILTTDAASPDTAKLITGCAGGATPPGPPSSNVEIIYSGSHGGGGARTFGTASLMAGKKFSDYESILIAGYPASAANYANVGTQGKAHSIIPVPFLVARSNVLFEVQTFSGDDSGSLGVQYLSDTSFRWGTYRTGRFHEIWGINKKP